MAGVIVLVSKETLQHHGIFLSMEGLVNLQLSSKSVGVFEAFYNSVKVQGIHSDSDSLLCRPRTYYWVRMKLIINYILL